MRRWPWSQPSAPDHDTREHQLYWLGLCVTVILSVAGRALIVGLYSESVPFWDQWDSEGAFLIKPYVEGTLRLSDLIAAHNEHRILWTRLVSLLLFEFNGRQWDNLVSAYANTLLFAAVMAVLYVSFARSLFGARKLVMSAALIGAACLPFGWENTLVGFQSQVYMMVGSAAVTLVLAAKGSDKPVTSVAVVAGAMIGLFTMASGLLAAVTASAVLLCRAQRGTLQRRPAIAGAVVLLALAGAAYVNVPVLEHHRNLRASGVGALLRALWIVLSWPFPGSWYAPLLVWAPTAWFLSRPSRVLNAAGGDLFALGFTLWSLLQATALSLSRGEGMVETPSRYGDILAVGGLVNVYWALRASDIAVTQRGRSGRLAALVAGTFALVYAVGFLQRLPRDLEALASRFQHSVHQTNRVRAFVAYGDSAELVAPFLHVPYPDPERLRNLLSDPTIRAVLPATVREPLQPPRWNGSGAFAREHAGSLYFADSCGVASCVTGTGRLRLPKLAVDADYVRVPLLTSAERSGLNVGVCSSRRTGCDLTPLRTDTLTVAMPKEGLQLLVDDSSPKSWVAVGRPTVISGLAYSCRRLAAWTRRVFPHESRRTAIPTRTVALAVEERDNLPIAIGGEQRLSASTVAPRTGLVLGVDVLIGTFHGRSNGYLELRLCMANACTSARARLRSARDNDFVSLMFPQPLRVVEGGRLTLQFSLASATEDLAFWVFPATAASATIEAQDDRSELVGKALKARLKFL